MRVESSIYAFAEDMRGEGPEPVIDRILGYGCDGVTVAAAYHRARDVTPHGPARVTLRQDGIHFPPPQELFRGLRLVPPLQPDAGDGLFATLRELTLQRGARLHGWTVFLHNTTLGLAHPVVTQQNCFGDRAAPADLCPSHPDVRAYADALARSVARQGVDTVVAESLHFGYFRHGYHHDRCFVDLGPVEEFLLGLCFCVHCRARGEAAGADAETARAEAERIVRRVLDGGAPLPGELSPDNLRACAGEAVARYVGAREETVTTLAASIARGVAAEGARLVFLDLTGALNGYADGRPTGSLACEDAWQIGVDPAAIGAVAPGYAILGYARDPARLAADVAAYRALLGNGCELRVTLRPGPPDTPSAASLTDKLHAAAAADAVDFYNYGMYPFPVLDRIRHSLSQARQTIPNVGYHIADSSD
jgi:hypothetical protein